MMDDDARSLPEPFEVAEALWLHAYQTLAARLPAFPDAPHPRPATPPGLPAPGPRDPGTDLPGLHGREPGRRRQGPP
ncbi:hypothetical protein ACWENA_37645, partial [Streptomyces sp. NPDC004779]